MKLNPALWLRIIRLVTAITFVVDATAAFAQPTSPLSDVRIRQLIIQNSVAAYNATGHPCACPYQSDRAGHACGGRSAYNRPGGAVPLCYPQDVTLGMISDWRRQHR